MVETIPPNSGPGGITVGEFFRAHGESLHLNLIGPEGGMDRKIRD